MSTSLLLGQFSRRTLQGIRPVPTHQLAQHWAWWKAEQIFSSKPDFQLEWEKITQFSFHPLSWHLARQQSKKVEGRDGVLENWNASYVRYWNSILTQPIAVYSFNSSLQYFLFFRHISSLELNVPNDTDTMPSLNCSFVVKMFHLLFINYSLLPPTLLYLVILLATWLKSPPLPH